MMACSWLCNAEEALVEQVRNADYGNNESFVPNDSCRDALMKHWKQATAPYHVDKKEEESRCLLRWFDRLWKLHSEEETRCYHTPVHLEEMLGYFQLFATQENEENATIVLATFFHDAIYNAKSTTNEEDSARLFENFAKDVNMDPSLRQNVVDFILATKKHVASSADKNSQAALALFLDLDLAVLGKTASAYDKYAALIRKEYLHLPHAVYCEKRSQVLRAFLEEQPRIYGTSAFAAALEDRARSNLRREIKSLLSGVIPS
jgi:predicted metal-dependent HD superfamily phosphohydrolase